VLHVALEDTRARTQKAAAATARARKRLSSTSAPPLRQSRSGRVGEPMRAQEDGGKVGRAVLVALIETRLSLDFEILVCVPRV
jgi:hypothetical protein